MDAQLVKISLPTSPLRTPRAPYSTRCESFLTGKTTMTDLNGAEAPAPVPAQEADYAYRSFHEYRWDLDKDFLVSQLAYPLPCRASTI